MSVINKMLRDLDQRNAPDGLDQRRLGVSLRSGTVSLPELQTAQSGPRYLVLVGVLFGLLLLAAAAYWWRLPTPKPVASAVSAVAAVAAPASAVASAQALAVSQAAAASGEAPALVASAASAAVSSALTASSAASASAVARGAGASATAVAAPASAVMVSAASAPAVAASALHPSTTVAAPMPAKPASAVPKLVAPVPAKPASVVSKPVAPLVAQRASTPALAVSVPARVVKPASAGAAATASASTAVVPDSLANTQRQQQGSRDALAQAQSLWNSGSHDAAIDLLQQAVAVAQRADGGAGPQDATSMFATLVRESARLQLADGRTAAVYAQLVSLEPQLGRDADVWALRANAAQRLGRHTECVDAYNRALALRPGEQRWMLGVAVSLAALGETANASAMAERARAVGPISPEVLTYLQHMGVKITAP